jgi:muramoyltetrapeptide carboxypeptidase
MTVLRRFRPDASRAAFFSPSGSVSAFPRRTQRAVDFLQRTWGDVDVSALGPEETAAAPARAATLQRLLEDPTVGLIIATTGGYTSLCLLEHLDRDVVRAARKPIVGFSDVTALLLGLHVACDIPTFHGPTALSNLGELGASQVFAAASLLRAVGGPTAGMVIDDPAEAHELFRFWDSEDAEAPALQASPRRRVLREGRAQGQLVGGNLDTLVAMAATPFAPSWRGRILFWEAAFGNAEKLERDLSALDLAGVFREVAGMVVGRPFRIADAPEEAVYRRAAEIAHRYGLPTIAGCGIGHTTPCATLPIGARAELDTERGTLTMLEDVTT